MNGASAGVVPARVTHDESIIAYFNDGFTMDFVRGETIINGVDDPPGVFLIKEGFVKAYSVSKAGQGNLLLIHEAGDVLPLPWALDGAHTTGLYYEALTDVTAIRSSKDTLRTAMGKNTWLAQEILKQAVNIISTYTQRIQTLEFRSARGRIISELMHLTERFGKLHGSGSIIDAPITHQDIADSINMSRETASRALEELTKEGLIGQDEHLFTILDLQKLQDALS